jgi:hypothetical protein
VFIRRQAVCAQEAAYFSDPVEREIRLTPGGQILDERIVKLNPDK